jgi:hypothetical protein
MKRSTPRDPERPRGVDDYCELLGWSRPTVIGALKAGQLPGYQNKPGGKWSVPPKAFASVADGTWIPQAKPIVPTHQHLTPITTMKRLDRAS